MEHDPQDPRSLTRDDFAAFLPNQRSIRAFEQLFGLLPSGLTDLQSQVSKIEQTVGVSTTNAQQALELVAQFANILELIAQLPFVHEYIENNLDLIPRQEVGTLGEQQADSVEIKGGTVEATLTNEDTQLIATKQALTDGAAAATGTLTNAPAAGNPTKWVPIDDNGVTRHIPAW